MTSGSRLQSKRVLIVGGVAGGASCAARLRRLDEQAEIIIFERGPYVSFANCGLPYYVGEVIREQKKLLVASPKIFACNFNIDVRVHHEVTRIDRNAKTIEVLNHAVGQVSTERYDVLVLAPGASPIKPPLPGIDREGIFSLRNIPDSEEIRKWIEEKNPGRAVVVGGGFIGLEMVENLVHRGLKVTLLEMLPQVMPPLDAEMVSIVHDHLREKGVHLCLNSPAAAFEPGTDSLLIVKTKSGESHPADLVILGLGVRPEIGLAKQAGLEIGSLGGIQVDEQMRTGDPDIFAVGDAIEVKDFITGKPTLIPLAGPANRQGRIAADAIDGRSSKFRGVQGTAVCGIFDLTIASTGASEKVLKKAAIPYEKAYIYPSHHVGYYPGAERMALKLLFSPDDGKVLGAQSVGRAGIEKRIDVIAMAIQMGATVYDLEESELCYAPQYGAAKDPVNIAGFVAANHLRGDSLLAYWEDYFLKSGEKPLLVDVRSQALHKRNGLPEAINIPLCNFRERMEELPRDREIWISCHQGYDSYLASRILKQKGYQVRNLTGSILSYHALKAAGMLREE